MTDDHTTILTSAQILRLADAVEPPAKGEAPADVTAFVLTAEVVMTEAAYIGAVLNHSWTVRKDEGEWVFLDPEGAERGQIYDVKARPRRHLPQGTRP
jgi:hypothetical protein